MPRACVCHLATDGNPVAPGHALAQATDLQAMYAGEGPHRCAETRDCKCANVISPGALTCGNLDFHGECNKGYHCCKTVCETCCEGGHENHCSECNCRCERSVASQRCFNYISTCYTPWVTMRFRPLTPNAAQQVCSTLGCVGVWV